MRSIKKLPLGAALALLALGMPLSPQPASSQQAQDITVFAAASLTNAMQDIAEAFTKQSGVKVKNSFASSSALAKQIEAGAAAHIYFSADEEWMDYVAKLNLIEAASRKPMLGNRLVLVVPADKPLKLDLADRAWLSKLPSGRIATGDPAHVPVGKYAQQALTKQRIWAEAEPRLARADNVRNALVLVERGEASAGIVYSTDAAVSKLVAVAGAFPETLHDPIVYPVALLRGQAQDEAKKFYDFLATSVARDIFAKHGFAVR